MKHRSISRLAKLLAATLLFAAPRHATAAAAHPNIVIIYTDDQGYGDVSALNPNSKFQTPHIDRLVREGLTFTDGHCSDTVCTPSRYGLLTGRYSWRSRLKRGVMGAEGECLIENGRMTLASLLRDNGYTTAMIGKWHLGMQFDGEVGQRDWSKPFTDGPIEKGFDHFFGIPASMNYGVLTYLQQDRVLNPANLWTAKKPGLVQGDRASYRIMPPYETERSTKAEGRRKPLEVADDFVDSEVLRIFLDKATKWIDGAAADARKGKPFFLYLPLTSPHKPVCPQKEFIGKSQAGNYGDFMIETDYRVGQLLASLDRHNLADNTIVIFTADNGGENTYKDRIERFGHSSNAPFRGGKRDLYEGGHRVPFIVRWPAKIRAGSQVKDPVCQTDLLATFADLVDAKLPADAGEDSFSLMPAFMGMKYERPLRAPLIHHSAAGMFSIRDGNWKLNLGRGSNGTMKPKKGEPAHELYNLKSDPGENANLITDKLDIAKRLTREITDLVQNGRSNPGPKQANAETWWPQLTWIPAPDGKQTRPRGRKKK
jgi:arylsulfatase A